MTLEAAGWAFGDGPATGGMAESAFLLRTGWTWRDYLDAPDEVVAMMMLLLNAEAEAARGQAQG